MRSILCVCFGLLLNSAGGWAQTGATGHWEGDIEILGQSLSIRVDLSAAGDSLRGSIDIPEQGAVGLPLRSVRATGKALSFELPAGPGLATFDGTMLGDSVRGVFRQAGMTGSFRLRRVTSPPPPIPAPPPPYAMREVRFSQDGISLAGTLTIPPSPGLHPAVILLTGSGAQTRDEDVFGFKVFATLADTLTRAGMAVLRFDDRGMGGSTGSLRDATTLDYADDARSAFEFLSSFPGIDRSRIGILGHSEGGVAGALAASEQPGIAFLVLMAGPAVRGDTLILGQVETLARTAGLTAAEIQDQLSLQRRVFDAVRADSGWDSLRLRILREGKRRSSGDDSLLAAQVDRQLRAVRTPWFRCFIDLDPAEALRTLSIPLLALFGEKDVQVPPVTNRPVLEALQRDHGKGNLTIAVVPGANHLFQAAQTGLPAEYAKVKKEFSGEFLGTLIPWLVKHEGLRK